MSQIINITSEALQATIRRLLPSQQGFGEDLQASNVITPIIDLTPTAEGSALDTDLARALSFGSQTAFKVQNSSTTVTSTPGFWRIVGTASSSRAGSSSSGLIVLGQTLVGSKNVWGLTETSYANGTSVSESFDLIVFLPTGGQHYLEVTSTQAQMVMEGSIRQVADTTGNVVNPDGFTF